MVVINVDVANSFAFLDGEEDDEVIMAAARARFEAEKVRVKAEAEEKASEEAEARRLNYWRYYSGQPYNGETGDQTRQYQNRDAGEGYYGWDHPLNGSNGNRPVNSESGSRGCDYANQVDRGYNVDGGNNQRYHGLVYNGYPSNGSSSHGPQEGNGGINHNRREVVQQWVPRTSQPNNAAPRDFVSDENQQVVDAESEYVNRKKGYEEEYVMVVEEDYRELMEYEKSLLEKKKEKMVSLKGGVDCREVTIDKNLQSMKPLGKRSEDRKVKTDQKAEEKKTVLKMQKAPQNIVTQKIGLKFWYKPPVERRREYNNDRGGQNLEGDRPNAGCEGDVNNGNNSEVPPNGRDRRQYGANARESRQEAEGNVAHIREANNKKAVDGETANVASRGPSLPLPRVEDPAQFPPLGSSSV